MNTEFASSAVMQVRAETQTQFEAMQARIDELVKHIPAVQSQGASNAGGDGAQSHADAPLVNNSGKPATVEEPVKTYPTVICSLCDGEVPKSIAKRCLDCDLSFHLGHYQRHRDEWPCLLIDFDLCPWCNEHIEEPDIVAD